jgi:gamma-glutamylcyclotransferase (GGCT)/AIG2-like uncharacterized protein YtfP
MGRPSEATADLFAYGTLMIDEVISALIGRTPRWTTATASGWHAVRLPGRVYPGLVRDARRNARGRRYHGLTPAEWIVLDEFEDTEYQLTEIGTSPSATRAFAYTWHRPATTSPWHLDQFISHDLSRYLRQCEAWRAR